MIGPALEPADTRHRFRESELLTFFGILSFK